MISKAEEEEEHTVEEKTSIKSRTSTSSTSSETIYTIPSATAAVHFQESNSFSTSKMSFIIKKCKLSIEHGEDNEGFYFTTEEAKTDNTRMKFRFGVVNVPMHDPADQREGRYACAIALDQKKLFLMIPKVRQHDLNTNALFKNDDSDADGHAGLATRMKGGNLCNRVKIYEVDTSELGLILNKFKKDSESYDARSTPTMIEWAGEKRILLEKEDKVVLLRFYHPSTHGCNANYTEVPEFTLKYRFVITNSKKKLCVDSGATDDSTAALA